MENKKKEYSTPKCIELGNMVKITQDQNGGSRCDNAIPTNGGNAKC